MVSRGGGGSMGEETEQMGIGRETSLSVSLSFHDSEE